MGYFGHKSDSFVENKQFEFENQEYIQEGLLLGFALGALKAVGIFLAANALLVGAILLSGKLQEKEKKKSQEDVLKNPKSKALIVKSLEKLREFIIQNLPNEAKKYVVKNEDKIDFFSAEDKKLRITLVSLDLEKMVIDLATPKCKSLDDVYKLEFPYNPEEEDCTEQEFYQSIYEDPDQFIDMDEKRNKVDYSKVIDIIDKCEFAMKKINKEISKSNFNILFDNYSYTIEYNGTDTKNVNPAIEVLLKFSTPSISSYSDKDIEFIAKTCGVSVQEIKGSEENK